MTCSNAHKGTQVQPRATGIEAPWNAKRGPALSDPGQTRAGCVRNQRGAITQDQGGIPMKPIRVLTLLLALAFAELESDVRRPRTRREGGPPWAWRRPFATRLS